MKTQVHHNSLLAYHKPERKIGRNIQSQQIKLILLKHGLSTCRTIASLTGIELSSVRRACHEMENADYGKPVLESIKSKCSITGETVKHFKVIDNQLNLF